MKLDPRNLAPGRPAQATGSSDRLIGHGMDLALVTVVFLGIGYALDRWLGTKPVFMIVLFAVGLVGQFVKLWYQYDARMRVLDAERAAASRSQR